MILSGADVRQYIRHGGLKFTPDLSPIQFQQNGIDLVLEESETPSLSGGGFCLGRTREIVTMPNDLMAFVQLRSSWARKGWLLPPTVIDAGFSGMITLEIIKFGLPEMVPVGERFAHAIFAKLSTPSAPYAGKYQGQTGITGAKEDLPLTLKIPDDLKERYDKCCDPDGPEYSTWECTLIERIAEEEAGR